MVITRKVKTSPGKDTTGTSSKSTATGGGSSPGAPGADGDDGLGFTNRGAWSGATGYAVNDVVNKDGSSYGCILAHTNHAPPNGTYWALLASKGDDGDDGDDGVGFTERGAWNSGTAYAVNDVVSSAGSSYVCISAHTNHVPPNATYWDLLASKGDPGDDGVDGSLPSSVYDPRVPPSSPSSRDDEFTTSSLDGKWTVVSSPGGTFTVTYNKNGTAVCVEGPGAASSDYLLLRQTMGAEADAGVAFTLTAKFTISSVSGTVYAFVEPSDNATWRGGNYFSVGLESVTGVQKCITYDGTLNEFTSGTPVSALWVKYQRTSGNSVGIWTSADGENWSRVRGPATKSWNIDYLFLLIGGQGTASQPFRCECDFVRVNDDRSFQYGG